MIKIQVDKTSLTDEFHFWISDILGTWIEEGDFEPIQFAIEDLEQEGKLQEGGMTEVCLQLKTEGMEIGVPERVCKILKVERFGSLLSKHELF